MDYRPLAVFSHPDRYGVHNAPAVRGSVARLDIDMQARKAIRAVVSVLAARALRHCRASAHFADKSFVAGVGLVITFFVLFAFVFAIHFSSRGLSCGRNGRVCFICRPPGQRTLSDDFVINFKQNLLVFLFKKRSDDRYLAHCEIKVYLPRSFLKRLIIAPYQPNNQLKWYLAKP